jgi:hypothetical protein
MALLAIHPALIDESGQDPGDLVLEGIESNALAEREALEDLRQ